MASTSQSQKGRNATPSTLDADIEVLDRAKGTCDIPPAQIAFNSASALLTTIRVRSHLFRGCEVRSHVHPGLHGRKTGLLRTWEDLCRCMQNSRPRIEGERIRRTQSVSAGGNRRVDYVSWINDARSVSPTDPSIAEPWPPSRTRSPSRVNELRCHEYSMRGAIRIRSRVGNWTSSGSFKSSTYVKSVLP